MIGKPRKALNTHVYAAYESLLRKRTYKLNMSNKEKNNIMVKFVRQPIMNTNRNNIHGSSFKLSLC